MEIFISLLVFILLPLLTILILKALPLWIAGKASKAQKPKLFCAMWTYLVLYIFLIMILLVVFKGSFQFETSSLALIVAFDSLVFLTGAMFLKRSYEVSNEKIGIYLSVGVVLNIVVAFSIWYLISVDGIAVIAQLMADNGVTFIK